MSESLHTDGNDIGGLLAEAFGTDMTVARRRCTSCGGDNPIAAHRAYHGAAVVLRCPSCDDVALRIARLGDRVVFELRGSFRA
jgi:hypothetical protein